jgi:hypothetical protein
MQLVFGVKHYWLNRGLLGVGRKLSIEALARGDTKARNSLRCRGLFEAGQLAFYMGDYGQAQGHLESLAIARKSATRSSRACSNRWDVPGHGDVSRARGHLEDAVVARAGTRRQAPAFAAQNALAQLHRTERTFDRPSRFTRASSSRARFGDRDSVAIGLLNQAMTSIDRARPSARPQCFPKFLRSLWRWPKPVGQSALEVCAGLAASRGHWQQAALFFGAAEPSRPRPACTATSPTKRPRAADGERTGAVGFGEIRGRSRGGRRPFLRGGDQPVSTWPDAFRAALLSS